MIRKLRLKFVAVCMAMVTAVLAVVCLSIFAALAMSTAMREQRFSEQYNKSAVNYYQADAEAVRIFEQILDG